MGVAPALPWRKASGETLRHRLLIPAWVGTGTVVLAVALGARGVVPLVVFGLGGFVAGASLRQIVLATRRQGWRGLVGRTNGGMIVHLGVVIVAVGVVASSAYVTQADYTLRPGQTAHLEGHSVTYLNASTRTEGNVVVQQARIRIDGGRVYAPKLKKFANANQVVGTPSVRSTPVSDVYLSLLSMPSEPNGPITLRVYIEPLVSWIWAGAGLIFVGAFFAAFPGRRRRPTDPVSAPLADPAPELAGDAAVDRGDPVGVR
jgi:cytochrome c-type biogenesis protein CcmF